MRILHYIAHAREEDLLSQYLATLTPVQERMGAEVCLATKRDNVGKKIDVNPIFCLYIRKTHTIIEQM